MCDPAFNAVISGAENIRLNVNDSDSDQASVSEDKLNSVEEAAKPTTHR